QVRLHENELTRMHKHCRRLVRSPSVATSSSGEYEVQDCRLQRSRQLPVLESSEVLVGYVANDVQPADLFACRCIHPPEELLGAEIARGLGQVDEEILRVQIVTDAGIGGVMRDENVCKWSRGVRDICASIKSKEQFPYQPVNCGRRF